MEQSLKSELPTLRYKKCPKCHADVEGFKFCPNCGKKLFTSQRKRRKRSNGEGCAYKPADRNTWIVAVTIDGTQKRFCGFKTEAEANEFLKKNIDKQEFATFSEMWSACQPKIQKLSKGRQGHYATAYKLCSSLYNKEMSTITTADLQRVIDRETKTYHQAKPVQTVMSYCFNLALANGMVPNNLARYVELPPEGTKKSKDAFTKEEIIRFWKGWESGDTFCGYILVMIYSGTRPGEFRAITRDNTDFKNKCFHDIGTKNEEAHKDVIFADAVESIIKELFLLSHNEYLYPYKEEKFRRDFKMCCMRNGCRALRPYDTRHTFATFMLRGNAVHAQASKAMRQANLDTIEQYEHLNNEDAREAVNVLNDIYRTS